MSVEVSVIGTMQGQTGYLTQNMIDSILKIPQQFRGIIKYLNVQNTTDNSLKVFAIGDDINTSSPVMEIGSRMVISFKLSQRILEGVKIIFDNPDTNSYSQIKTLEMIWSENSKMWNHSLAPSFPKDTVNHVIIDGTPNVNINNTPHVIVDNLTSSYVLSKTITANNTPVNLSVNGVGGKTNYCSYLDVDVTGGSVGTSDIIVNIYDTSTILWTKTIPKNSVNGSGFMKTFPIPLAMSLGGSIVVTANATGLAGVSLNVNIGYIQK